MAAESPAITASRVTESSTWQSAARSAVGLAMHKESSDTLASENRRSSFETRDTAAHYFQKILRKIVGAAWFETLIAIIILANCVTIGFEVETLLGRAKFYTPRIQKTVDNIFAVVFLLELFMRFKVVGWRSYVPGCGVPKSISVWNLLEAIIVLVTCTTAWFDVDGGTLQVITVLRALRLMRVARIVSRVRLFHEVWLLLRGLAGSMRVLFWTVVVIFIITYMFAVFGVVLISVEIQDVYEQMHFERDQALKTFGNYTDCTLAVDKALRLDSPELDAVGAVYYNTNGIWMWIFTLLQVLTLDSWMSVVRPIQDIVGLSWVFFYLYIALVVFVLMNLVTAIIVDNALKRSQQDEKEIKQQKKREQKKAEKRCKRLFASIDEDENDELTLQELKNACENPWLGKQLKVLDITGDNAEEVFRMMDTGDGVLTLEEFFEGTKRMQGPAEGRDMVRVLAITQRLAKDIRKKVNEVRRDGVSVNGMSSTSLPPVPGDVPLHSPVSPKKAQHVNDLISKLDVVRRVVGAMEARIGALEAKGAGDLEKVEAL